MDELKVICNPFVALDHDGVPAGVYPFDPDHGGGSRRWVGATIDRGRSGPEKPAAGRQQPMALVSTGAKTGRRIASVPVAAHRHFYAFDLSPQRVPKVAHYIKGILHGDIFPADQATAAELGLKKFTPPQAALSAARDKAIVAWRAVHGKDPDYNLWPEVLRPKGGAIQQPPAEEPPPEAPVDITTEALGAGSET